MCLFAAVLLFFERFATSAFVFFGVAAAAGFAATPITGGGDIIKTDGYLGFFT